MNRPGDMAQLEEGDEVIVEYAQRRRHADRAALVWLLFLGLVALGTLWAWDDLKAWLQPHLAAFRTSGPVDCRQPTDFEQLHIILAWREGKLTVTGCMYVGAKGTYRPSRPARSAL